MNIRYTTLVAILLAASAAHADEGLDYKFSGFGTVGAVRTNTDEGEYRSGLRQGNGAKKSLDFGVVSRVGLQGNVQFNSTFSAVGQVLTSHRDGQDGPQVEWLFGQAKLASWADVRLGRMVLPVFMQSDTRNVGFASHWIHAPHEVYDTYPPTSFDGIQAVLRAQWGGINFTAQPSWGKTESSLYYALLPGRSKLKYSHLSGLYLSAVSGDWTVRYGTVIGKDATFVNPVMTVAAGGDHDRFSGVGLQYDNGSLLFLSEYTTRRQSTGMFDSNGYYVSVGYRIDAWLPYVSTGKFDPKGFGWGGAAKDSTESAGLRWDAMKNIAVKYQYESTTPNFQFANGTAAFVAANNRVRVHSVAVDFVF